ncbi:MAG: hypothetical protein LBV41_10675 [Cytophagaceae bacterium]|nr:hypothetical protein [Cytophagaceae bacterium]
MKTSALLLLLAILSALTPAFSASQHDERFLTVARQVEVNAFSHTQTAKELTAELQAMAVKYPENIDYTIQALYFEATINYYQLINDSSLLAKCTFIANTWNTDSHLFERALLNHTLTLCHSVDGNYSEAFSLALKSLEQFQSINETAFVCKIYYLLGNICLATQSRNEAMEYYRQALSTAVHGQRDYYLPFIALYSNMVYEEEGKATAMDSLTHFVEGYNDTHLHFDAGLLATACFNLGSIYYIADNSSEGYRFYALCKHHIDTYYIDNHTLLFGLNYNFGELFTQKGDYSKALEYSHLAKEMAITNNSLVQRSYVLLQISSIYNSMNRLDSAYNYLSQYVEVRNRIISKSRTIDSYKAYISIYMESLQKELTIAAQGKRQFIIITISVIVILLLALLLLIVLQQKRRTMQHQIEQNMQIQKLQEDKIEAQKRELSAHALLLSEKNTLLQQIDEHVASLLPDSKEVKAIKQIVKVNLTTEQAWQNFMIHFNEVHPQFFEKLKAHTPSLTENNLHLCAYLRISMTSKQIAQVLNMSFENVRKSAYRLKKKLLLGEDDNLYDFLRRL